MCKSPLLSAISVLLVIMFIAPAWARRVPPGAHAEREAPFIAGGQPVLATYFFYWYDYPTKAHILNPAGTDALLHHPARFDGTFSYESDHWYLKEFRDMVEAGIDIVLPVYWGHGRYPECEPWSRKGLEHIARALDHMSSTGQLGPKVGMFYDTTTLMYDPQYGFGKDFRTDLTTEEGRESFFLTVKSFFDAIPREHWALIDNMPVVWLYDAAFAKDFDDDFFDRFRALFAVEYGVEPYIVAERSWEGAGDADAWYAWGAAQSGSHIGHGVVGIGPGYDDSRVPGRQPTIVDRYNGLLYEWGWIDALNAAPPIVVIETWNELHEGTEICETRELGRKYIELTGYYSYILKLPPGERADEAAQLIDLYFNTVTMEPAEIWRIDLERGYVDFPVRVEAKKRNIFGHLEWNTAGSEAVMDPSDDDFILNKGEILRLDYGIENLEEKILMGPLPYLTGSFAAGGRELPVGVRLEPALVRRIDCFPAAGEMTMDGDLSDWAGVQALIIADISHVGGPGAPYPLENTGAGYPGWHPADASMEIYTCWDEENLYMAVATRDDVPLDGVKGKKMLRGDCIQVAFELDDDRDGTMDTSGDVEFAMTEIGGVDRFYSIHRPFGLQGPLDRVIRHAVVRTGNLTVYEFSIPIIEFGIDEIVWGEEYAMGFNVAMHDDDGDGWEGFIQLAPDLVYGKDTRRFARIVLVEE